jgi:FkbM family methyltransferase
VTAEYATRTESLAVHNLLSELRSEDAGAMSQRVASAYDRLATPFQRSVVICGAGQLGRFVLPGVRAAGIDPLAFCDNNPALWGTAIDGVHVLSPAAAVEAYNGKAAFLAAVYNASGIHLQLRALGCEPVVPYPAFFWQHWRCLPNEVRLDLPQRIVQRAEEITSAYHLLADEKSRREFRAQVRWRCLLDYACLPKPDPASEMYFARDILRLSASEVFADCGAFDGDSIRSFLEKTKDQFRRIYAFEPDEANVGALGCYVATLPASLRARIEILPWAVGRHDGLVRFNAEGSVASKIGEAGSVELACRSLDSALRGREVPTFIKMDIEGAEVDALPGAAETLRRTSPVVAVCAYHRCDHLWQIPALLHVTNSDYKIFLRRYAEECWETVYYAVPPERLRPKHVREAA